MLESVVKQFFEENNSSLTFEESKKQFNIKTETDIKELQTIFDNLVKNGFLYLNKNNEYILFPEHKDMVVGKLRFTKNGIYHVDTNDSHCIYIDSKELNGAICFDTVIVNNIYYDKQRKLHGSIDTILDRELTSSVFEFVKTSKDNYYLKSCNYKVAKPVKVNKNELQNLVDGDRVLVSLDLSLNDKVCNGTIINKVCHRDDPDSETLTIAGNYGIDPTFSEESLKELQAIPNHVKKKDKLNRKDLTGDRIFTIDCDDTKDMDDAISIKKLPNGHYKLGVHIADVSYYVKEGSALYKDAYRKSFSSYLANTVLPMLPHKISNGICSLNPDEERLTLTFDLDIDENGNVVDYTIYDSVIKSRKKMKYSEVNRILEDNEDVAGYEPFISDLQLLAELSKKMEQRKQERGYINFESKDVKILTDDFKETVGYEKREQKTAEKIIENCMLAANNTIAEDMFWRELPFLFRVHEAPYEGKISETLDYINSLGFKIHYKQKELTPKNIQIILNQLSAYECYSLLSEKILRSMKKAFFSVNPDSHFGLALDHYSQMTSPIRRFADLQGQIMYKNLRNKLLTNEERQTILKNTASICAYISYKEKQCIKAEREVNKYKIAKYMSKRPGDIYEGFISFVSPYGITVMVDQVVEGKVEYENIKWDKFSFDKQTNSAVGKNSKVRYRVGDKILLKVENVSLDNRTIYFDIQSPLGNILKTKPREKIKSRYI